MKQESKSIKAWCSEVHTLARSKGWYDNGPRSPLENHMLMVSEIAEATEEVRKGTPAHYVDVDGKLQGELIELADVVIRIMDYCQSKSFDLELAISLKHEFNKNREYRHGNKKI